jgi:HD-GYP domain-containing protein (c-di-GMP phosphodiesterase class II)
MQLISLDQVFKMLQPGVPLPWGVRDAAGQLLLAKGHVVADQVRLTDLLNRGMFVDVDEVKRSASTRESESPKPPAEGFSSRWEALQRKLRLLLRAPGEPDFLKRLREVVEQIASFADGHTDQIIFLIVRHDYSQYDHYAEAHSLHVAALCNMVSRRLGWPDSRRQSLIGAALSMNLTVINLQAQLAGQRGPLSAIQRQDMDAHPLAAADLLRSAGLQDEEWLGAVEQHHECPDGSGYPRHEQAPGDMSQLLRFIDCFTAKHSARAGRPQQPAHQAARDLYAQSAGNPLAAALIKECGIYPPGCYVKLASGETAVVTRRGMTAKAPLVAAILNANGEPLSRPVQRDSAHPTRAITGTVAEKSVMVHVTADQLYG